MKTRIRSVKPGLFLHEELYDLAMETKLGAKLILMFIALLCACDREGRFEWRPRQLKSQLDPYSKDDFEVYLDALAKGGFIQKYMAGSQTLGLVVNFTKHQVINNREPASELPGPDPLTLLAAPLQNSPSLKHCKAEGERERERELELEGELEGEREMSVNQLQAPTRAKRKLAATQIDPSWQPTPELRQRAIDLGLDPDRERDIMVDWALAKGEPRIDWQRTFSGWIRRSAEFQSNRRGPAPAQHARNSTGNQALDYIQQKLRAIQARDGQDALDAIGESA